jgi:hypothetical protein
MTAVVEGVIRGKTIELAVDPGLEDGAQVEVVIRRKDGSRAWGRGIKSTAGALSEMPPGYFDDLEKIVVDRQKWPYREVPE